MFIQSLFNLILFNLSFCRIGHVKLFAPWSGNKCCPINDNDDGQFDVFQESYDLLPYNIGTFQGKFLNSVPQVPYS